MIFICNWLDCESYIPNNSDCLVSRCCSSVWPNKPFPSCEYKKSIIFLTPLSAQIGASKFQNLSQIQLKIRGVTSRCRARQSQVSFQIFLWCLKAKFQIPPLPSVIFAVNPTTRAASNLYYLQFCSSQPLLSPGTVYQKFYWVFKIFSEFPKNWVSFQILSEF